MAAVKTQIPASEPAPDRYWIFSPVQDLTLVLGTPLLILGTFALARRGGWMDGLLTFALALATAHYLPGILRAYGDRALFRRFRVRLIFAPLFLFAITATFAYLNLHIVLLLALLWGQWHWMMQVYGFARIYDAKARPEARTPAWLDRTMCLMWFGMCVFVLNQDLPSYVTRFYQSGGPHIRAEVFLWFARGWFTVTIAVSTVYLVRTIGSIRQGQSPNPLKLVLARLGDASAAARYLETAVRLDPEQYMAHNSLGELLMKQDKPNEARSHFEQALRIDPNYTPAKRNLASVRPESEK
jgi:tetratricopeptide (TPR) repeat protein